MSVRANTWWRSGGSSSRPVQPQKLKEFTPGWETSAPCCEYCSESIFADNFLTSIRARWQRERVSEFDEHAHERRAKDVLASSIAGCPFCSRLLAAIHGCVQTEAQSYWPANEDALLALLQSDAIMSLRLQLGVESTSQIGTMTVLTAFSGDTFYLQPLYDGLQPFSDEVMYSCRIAFHFTVRESEPQPSGPIYPQLRGPIHMGSEQAFQGIGSYMHQCDAHHQEDREWDCDAKLDDLPIRIIDVSSDPCKIVEYGGADYCQPYLTLSYSWGDNQSYVLTKSIMADQTILLDNAKLPKTIVDAVYVTRMLGFNYLWVDALCIVQDDEADMASEIARMHAIYQNSRLTVVSALTANVNEHFLVTGKASAQTEYDLKPLDVPLCGATLVLQPHARYDVDSFPINDRAWALQEHVVADHLLIYGPDGIEVACRRMFAKKQLVCNLSGHSRLLHDIGRGPYMLWVQIVGQYSRRSLTHAADKLIAISALARRLAPDLGRQYVAGLWTSWGPAALMWLVAVNPQDRLVQYRAPSWSWASCEGVIGHERPDCPIFRHFRIVECRVTHPSTTDQFGPVNSGYLKVHAVFREMDMVFDRTSRIYALEEGVSISRNGELPIPDCPGYEFIDHLWGIGSPQRMQVVYLATLIDERGGVTGMIVRLLQDDMYERVGRFRCCPEEFFDGCGSDSFYII